MTEMPRLTPESLRQLFPEVRPDDADLVDLKAVLGAVWRGRAVIAVITLAALIAGACYAFAVATPLYRASAVVMLDTRQDQIVDIQSVVDGLSGETSEINSELEVLRSRRLLGSVVDELGLLGDPEFNAALGEKGHTARAVTWAQEKLGLVAVADTPVPGQERDQVISALLTRLSVRNVPLSLVIEVTAETREPRKSALIADTVVARYVADQVAVKQHATEAATGWLKTRVAELRVELEAAESAVAEFHLGADLLSPEALLDEERRLNEQREQLETAIRNRRAAESGQSGITTDLAGLDRQIRAMIERENTLAARIAQQNTDRVALQQLSREAAATRALYEHFLTRLKETAAQQGLQQPDSRILSAAVVPVRAASPRRPMVLLLSLLLGLGLGAAFTLWRDRDRTGFRSAADLEGAFGVPVLGQIPRIGGRGRGQILRRLFEAPTSAAAEAIRNLRTSVMLAQADKVPQVIAMTSSLPGEGKTTNTLALAHNLSGLGRSVVLVEGDIRRRTLGQYFGSLPERGLASVLTSALPLNEAVVRPDGFGADILPGEPGATNAADLFASESFRSLIADLRTRYDVVLIDTPPVLVVPDARIIAQVADATLFTVKWDSTARTQLAEAMRMMMTANQDVTGMILSQISPGGMRRYGLSGQSGAYGGYGAGYYSG